VRAQAHLSGDAQHAARSGSAQRDETATSLHIWQSTARSVPLTIFTEMRVRSLDSEAPRMRVELQKEMCMQVNFDGSWSSVVSCGPRSGKLS